MITCCEASMRWSLCTPLYLYLVGVSRGSVHSKYAYYKITLSEDQRKLIRDGQHRVFLRCVGVCGEGYVGGHACVCVCGVYTSTLCLIYRLGKVDGKSGSQCVDHYPYEVRIEINTIRVPIKVSAQCVWKNDCVCGHMYEVCMGECVCACGHRYGVCMGECVCMWT